MNDEAQIAATDGLRQALVEAYAAQDDGIGRQLDRLADLAARLCNAPVGLVSLVDTDKQHFIGRSGTSLTETPRADSFCAHAMLEQGCMVVSDARDDDRFRDNRLVTGSPHIRFYAGHPLISREGIPLGSLCVISPEPRESLTDEQCHHLETLSFAVIALLERLRVERSSDQLQESATTAIAELEQRFQVLADAMPQLVWSTTPDGSVDYFNRLWCEFTGQPAEASYGHLWTRFLHEDDQAAANRCWAKAVATGNPYEIEYRLRHHAGEYRWVLARGMPMHDPDGRIKRWLGTCTDIHEQKGSAERLELLSRELSHRIKNIFAVIGGLVALTTRRRPEFTEPANELRDRILALGRAHDFVRSRGGMPLLNPHVRLTGLLQTLLAPYQDDQAKRIVITGGDVEIDDRSATPLALFFHELATNAAKYGALANVNGRVDVAIVVGDHVQLSWHESGGPPVTGAGEPGFGSSLVDMSIKRQLGGELDYRWEVSGLHVVARIPASVLTR